MCLRVCRVRRGWYLVGTWRPNRAEGKDKELLEYRLVWTCRKVFYRRSVLPAASQTRDGSGCKARFVRYSQAYSECVAAVVHTLREDGVVKSAGHNEKP